MAPRNRNEMDSKASELTWEFNHLRISTSGLIILAGVLSLRTAPSYFSTFLVKELQYTLMLRNTFIELSR
jgi:hypothetical protein